MHKTSGTEQLINMGLNIWFSTNFIKNQSPADHSRMKPWLYIPMAWVYFFSKQTSSSATTQTWIRPKELMLNVVGNLLSFSVHLVDLWCKGDHITRSSALNPTAPLLARCKFVYIYIFCLHIYYFFAYSWGQSALPCNHDFNIAISWWVIF